MCILRYTPITRPSASITAALLWYSPGARRSNSGAITTTPARCAARPSASVLGPGMGSARSNNAASSRCAKYCERNSSGRHTRLAPDAAASGASLVCLPELFRSQYFAQREDAASFDLAEPVPGPSTEALARAAQRAGVVVIAPLFERRAPGLYHNSAAVIDADGRVIGVYRKMHIPDDPAYYEKFYFAPGDLGFRAFDTRVGRIGALVCWDQWYPEGARLTALQGATVLLYPTAIGWHPKEKATHGAEQLDAWRTIQRGHAIANGCYVAAVNRVGHERLNDGGDRDGIEFWGSSFL